MILTTCKKSGKTIRYAETDEERKFLRGLINKSKRPLHILKSMGTSPRWTDALHPAPNNRKWNKNRRPLRQTVEVKRKLVTKVFPDGKADHVSLSYFPKRFKTITHAHQGWIR